MATKARKNKPFEFKPFSPKQLKLLNWWREGSPVCDCDIMIADGSIRSGKTIACICSFLQWSQETYSGEAFIIAGKTIGALKKNVIKPMLQILTAWGWEYEYNRSENYIEIGGNTYYMYDASNEASQDKLQGLTAAGAYADEVGLFPRSFIDQMLGRCSVDGAKVFMNCNPESPHHYIKVEFIDKAKLRNVYHLHFTMDDNLSLSQKVKDKFKRMFSGVFFKRFILGLWVASDGLVYQQFADNKDQYVVPDDYLEELDENGNLKRRIVYASIGVDFGGNKSAHSFTLIGLTEGYKELVVIDEWYLKKRITPKQLEEAFLDFVRKSQRSFPVYQALCDSAETTLIQGLEAAVIRSGVPIEVARARKGAINNRIAFFNSMIAQGRYKQLARCKNLEAAMETAIYDERHKAKDVRLDDGLMNIDSLDSLEYAAEPIMDDVLYL